MEKKTVKAIKTEVYSRVVGYYRPVDEWNPGKQEEFKERESIDLSSISSIPGGNEGAVHK